MDKSLIMEHLAQAKKSHVSWVQRAKLLIDGFPVDQDAIPLGDTECQFGIWLYGEGQKLLSLGNMDVIKEIEDVHLHLHDQYIAIFKIYFGPQKRSLVAKVLKSLKKVSPAEKEEAQKHFKNLSQTSENMLVLIGKLERRLSAMAQNTFDF